MKIVIIGLGSMGKRRLRLLKKHFNGHTLYGIDMQKERREFCAEEFHIQTFTHIEEAMKAVKPECAFICTSPLSHQDIIKQCLQFGLHIFTEINLVDDGYEENMKLAEKQKVKLFLSSSMIYRDELQFLHRKTSVCTEKICYSYHVGQYLPDWHPWESYKDFFVGNQRTNGCREILAIEMPWIQHIFGKVKRIQVQADKVTDLKIDYKDCYMILLEHENGNMGTFLVDVVSREPVRMLRVFNETLYFEWQGTPESLKCRNESSGALETILLYEHVEHAEGYNNTIIENEYINEMRQFFAELECGKEPIYGFKEDKQTLLIIDEIEGI